MVCFFIHSYGKPNHKFPMNGIRKFERKGNPCNTTILLFVSDVLLPCLIADVSHSTDCDHKKIYHFQFRQAFALLTEIPCGSYPHKVVVTYIYIESFPTEFSLQGTIIME